MRFGRFTFIHVVSAFLISREFSDFDLLLRSLPAFPPAHSLRRVRSTTGAAVVSSGPTLKAFGRAKVKQVRAKTGSFAGRNSYATDGRWHDSGYDAAKNSVFCRSSQ